MKEPLSKNFYRHEFECHGGDCCGHSAPMDMKFIEALQKFRDKVGAQFIIIRGFSCKVHNATIEGAAPDSYHCKAMAADIVRPPLFTSAEFAAIAREFFPKGGIGIYSNRIHVDNRDNGPIGWQG